MTIKTSVLTVLETRIIRFCLENISEQFAIRELARRTKTDYKLVHSTIQKLAQKNILVKKRHANIDLCSLNLKGDLTNIYYVEMLRASEVLHKHSDLKIFFNSVCANMKNIYYTIVVFGSFAKGKETRNSDLDLLIITPTRATGEEIERIVSSEGLFLKVKVHPIFLDEKQFVDNLSSKKLNVVVEAFKNHIIVAGVEGFYQGVRLTL